MRDAAIEIRGGKRETGIKNDEQRNPGLDDEGALVYRSLPYSHGSVGGRHLNQSGEGVLGMGLKEINFENFDPMMEEWLSRSAIGRLWE